MLIIYIIMINNNCYISTLTGIPTIKGNSITSINNSCGTRTPSYILKLKRNIFDRLLIPLINNDFNCLQENFFTLTLYEKKINKYKTLNLSNSAELSFYSNVLNIIRSALSNFTQTNKLIKKYEDDSNTVKFVFRLPMIQLKAEYEIYNLLFGKPEKGTKYDDSKIIMINKILKQSENIPSLGEIKEKLGV